MRYACQMTLNRRKFVRFTLAAGAMGYAFGPSVFLAGKQAVEPEIFDCSAIAAGEGVDARVEITIDRWTTDEERADLLEMLANDGAERAVEALADQDETGIIRFNGGTGYRLRYARQFQVIEGRRIVLATDRPIAFGEVPGNRETPDYELTLIQFEPRPGGTERRRTGRRLRDFVRIRRSLGRRLFLGTCPFGQHHSAAIGPEYQVAVSGSTRRKKMLNTCSAPSTRTSSLKTL